MRHNRISVASYADSHGKLYSLGSRRLGCHSTGTDFSCDKLVFSSSQRHCFVKDTLPRAAAGRYVLVEDLADRDMVCEQSWISC